MAIAFMANAQHFVYRRDVLDELGLEVPTTWDAVIEAADAAREAGLMDDPIAGTYKTGFNLGLEFVNHYLALGGELFEGETAAPTLVNDVAVAALERMKRITGYMDPDFLTMDTKLVVAELEQGAAAFANLWGSSAGAVLDGQGAAEGVGRAPAPRRRAARRRTGQARLHAVVGRLHDRAERRRRRRRRDVPGDAREHGRRRRERVPRVGRLARGRLRAGAERRRRLRDHRRGRGPPTPWCRG